MSRLQTTAGELARRGFTDTTRIAGVLDAWVDRGGPELDLDDFDRVAEPDQAVLALVEVQRRAPEIVAGLVAEAGWRRRVLAVLGGSSALAQFASQHPDELTLLRDDPVARGAQGWLHFMGQRLGGAGEPWVVSGEGAADRLRLANKAALLLVAARDLTADDPMSIVDDISAELAAIADAVLASALAIARSEVSGAEHVRFAVLAMGKCGAQELNYISDVDVVHVVEPADDQTSAEQAAQIGTRLAAALARICSSHTAAGSIWTVDANLRPEGKAGPLVRSLASCRTYYEKWAKNWEFQAMLKARPAAGDRRLGQAFVDMVSPLVWRAGERENFVAEAQAMRKRVISLISAKEADREIKLGAGGLRDTEFSVQLLQLVHGRADERLHVRGTFDGLRTLVDHGYIGRADGAELEAAYRFQRVLEHRVQLRRLRRTHVLPDDDPGLVAIGRTLGAPDPQQVRARWRASTRAVLRLQQRIFYSPLLAAVARIGADDLRLSTDAARARLNSLGFADPAQALRHIEALTRGHTRAVEIQRQLLPAMLGWIAEGANPDFGLLAFRQLSEDLGSSPWYLRALRDEGLMAERLAHLCASSRYVVDLLRRAPDSVQMLASDETLVPRTHAELRSTMLGQAARQDDPDKAIAAARGTRRRELARLAIADLLGLIDTDGVGQGLSDLASATVDAALDIASRDVEVGPIGVIAMGRWGGRELAYASDADAMFVVGDDTGPEGLKVASQVLRRMSDLLQAPGPDPALDIDTALRPEGKGGPPAKTRAGYLAYYERWSATWESQALVRATPGAGDLALCAEVLSAADRLRWPEGGLTRAQLLEIRKLKSRMENERLTRGANRNRNLKLGPGGLSDVEWTVQVLQMQHAHDVAALRTSSTMDALAALVGAGLMGEDEARDLERAWRLATRLRNAIMLVRGRGSDSLPTDARDLASIAVVLGHPRGHSSQLLEEWARAARRARAVADTYFWSA